MGYGHSQVRDVGHADGGGQRLGERPQVGKRFAFVEARALDVVVRLHRFEGRQRACGVAAELLDGLLLGALAGGGGAPGGGRTGVLRWTRIQRGPRGAGRVGRCRCAVRALGGEPAGSETERQHGAEEQRGGRGVKPFVFESPGHRFKQPQQSTSSFDLVYAYGAQPAHSIGRLDGGARHGRTALEPIVNPRLQPRYTAVGHVCVDIFEDGSSQAGGAAFYSALQAARLGLSARILTRGVPEEIERLLEPFAGELDLEIQPAAHTTTLHTVGSGRLRTQRVLEWAGPISGELEIDG